jgi:hypothetical protein
MDRENIIEKIRALRAQSQDKSTTVEEAATFARMAEVLIQKYSLAEVELEMTKISKEDIVDDGVPLTDWGQRQTVWQNILTHGLAKAYNCSSVLKWNEKGNPNIYAIGKPSDISLLRYQYTFFVVELTRLSHKLAPKNLGRGTGKTWFNSFYRGAVHAILASLKSAKEEVRTQASSEALVFIDQHLNAIEQFKAGKYPGSVTKQFGGNLDPDAYRKGVEAGSNLNPKPALAPGVKGLLT